MQTCLAAARLSARLHPTRMALFRSSCCVSRFHGMPNGTRSLFLFQSPVLHQSKTPVLFQRHIRIAAPIFAAAAKDPRTAIKRITRDDVSISFARSSGAGGQNVNKVNTKVDMRLNLKAVTWLEEDVKEAIRRQEKRRMNKEGELVMTSQRTRSQADNVEDALEKMQEILDSAWLSVQPIEEDPEKKKQLEKQKKIANENRIKEKKLQSFKKKERKAKIEW